MSSPGGLFKVATESLGPTSNEGHSRVAARPLTKKSPSQLQVLVPQGAQSKGTTGHVKDGRDVAAAQHRPAWVSQADGHGTSESPRYVTGTVRLRSYSETGVRVGSSVPA
jgi:hypothetical protein